MIRWFAKNGIAANFLMLGILVAGAYTALYRIPLEITPSLSWDTVMIVMPYRGGTAKDVERAILIPVEEALEGVKGIKHLHDGVIGDVYFARGIAYKIRGNLGQHAARYEQVEKTDMTTVPTPRCFSS